MKEPRSFKQRFRKKIYVKKIIYGDSAILFSKAGFVESLYFRFLKKFFKFFLKKKKVGVFTKKRYKVWFFIHTNFPLTKKSKNSRMGKGKGGFSRWIIRVKQNNKLLETRNLSLYLLSALVNKIQFKMNITLRVTRQHRRTIILRRDKYTWHL